MITNKNKSQNPIYFMKLALDQANINLGNTKVNPAVGCIIVKNDHVISSGFTSIKGRPHAEQNAINLSKTNLKNSELYVTLEPCSHYGKTPPCIKSINISLRKRPIDSESIEKFISKIVRNLEGLGENDIPTSTIGKFIMQGLANLDQVAYVRFASVYKNFKEAKDFEQFIGNLNVYKSE